MKNTYPNILLISAITKNKIWLLKKCLGDGDKLTTEDLCPAFYDQTSDKPIENVSSEVLRILDEQCALPKGVTLSTLEFVLYTIGHNKIVIEETLKADDINFNGCAGLPTPMTIAAKRGDFELAKFLISKTDERPVDECMIHFNNVHKPKGLDYDSIREFKNHIIDTFRKIEIRNKCQIMEPFIQNTSPQLEKVIASLQSNDSKEDCFRAFFVGLLKTMIVHYFPQKLLLNLLKIFQKTLTIQNV